MAPLEICSLLILFLGHCMSGWTSVRSLFDNQVQACANKFYVQFRGRRKSEILWRLKQTFKECNSDLRSVLWPCTRGHIWPSNQFLNTWDSDCLCKQTWKVPSFLVSWKQVSLFH